MFVIKCVSLGGIGIITDDAINRQGILEEMWLVFTSFSKLLLLDTKQKPAQRSLRNELSARVHK